ncbi:hypothetical protein KFE19_11675 [Dysosmobacter sp. Marseille-Q4140]|nr:hypothetical protein KFE19_11675 [Dysosmobacter sp. Marseille-Q4140]
MNRVKGEPDGVSSKLQKAIAEILPRCTESGSGGRENALEKLASILL